MNTFNVDITTFYGAGCGGGCCGNQASTHLHVDDVVAAELCKLLEEVPDIDERFGTKCVDKEHLLSAIEAGHDELLPIYDDLIAKGRDIMIRYWLIEADDDCTEEALEPSFYEDIESGTYIPSVSPDEAADKTDVEDVEYYGNSLWRANRDDYVEWVNSHIDEDPYFIADRKHVDISTIISGEEDSWIFYAITKIE